MEFNENEIKDIIISIISLAVISSINALFTGDSWFASFIVYLVAVSIALFTKLYSHKRIGEKFDCTAIYKFNYYLFIISMLTALLFQGIFVFAALGSIMINSSYYTRLGHKFVNISRREAGLIALSGPMANIVLAITSLLLYPLFPPFFSALRNISVFMALFSLVPIPPLEGHFILWWNRPVWLACFLMPLFLLFFGFSAFFSIIGIILLTIMTFVLWEKMF